MNSRKSSRNSDFREIWDMAANVRKQLESVDQKIQQARKSAYLPVDLNSDDDKAIKPRSSEMSAFERRLIHDKERRSTSYYHRRSSDSENHIKYSAPPVLPVNSSRPSGTDISSLPVSLQSRMFSVSEFLGDRPNIADTDLSRINDRSAVERRRNTDFVDYAQRTIDYDSSFKRSTRPNSDLPSTTISANIDKRSPAHQRRTREISDAVSSSDIRKPRLFSHLKSRSSKDILAENEVIRFPVDRNSMALDGGFGNERLNRGNSSTASGSNVNGQISHRIVHRIRSITSSVQSAQTSSRSSAASAFLPASPPSKLEKKENPSVISSSTKRQSTVDQLDSNSDNGNADSRASTSSKTTDGLEQRAQKRRTSSSEEGTSEDEENIVESLPSPRKQQRRVISPPRRRAATSIGKKTAPDDVSSTVPATRKSRNYDSAAIQAYIKRKRQERKLASQTRKDQDHSSIDKRRVAHSYGQDEIHGFIKQKKVDEQVEKRRAAERMKEAKLVQQQRFHEILEEQKKRKRIPVANMISGDPVPAAAIPNPAPEKRNSVKELAMQSLDHYQKRVNAIRAKYDLSKEEEAAVRNSRNEPTEASVPALNSGRTTAVVQNGTSNTLSRMPAANSERHPTNSVVANGNSQSRREEADEFNIINTILRKHPYLRVTTLYVPGATNGVKPTNGIKPAEPDISDSRRFVHSPTNSTTAIRNGNTPAIIPKPSDRSRRKPGTFGLRDTSDDDDGLSAFHDSTPTEAVSTLTLSSESDTTAGRISDAEEKRPAPAAINGNGMGHVDNAEDSSPTSSGQQLTPVAASNLRVRAGLNYMQALQYSVEQIEAAKEIGSRILAEQSVEAANNLMEAHDAARQWEQQLREARMSNELQRLRAEMDRTSAAHELRLANELTDHQRRLMESILTTNRQLVEQQNRFEETVSRKAAPADQLQLVDATKLAAEVAASAATAATLAALKHSPKSGRTRRSSGSRSASATSSLSSTVTSSPNAFQVKSDTENDRTTAKDSSISEKISTKSIRSEYSGIITDSKASNSHQAINIATDSTQRTASTVPDHVVTAENGSRITTGRSTVSSISEIGTQTKEISTARSVSTQKSVTSVEEAIQTESVQRRSSATATSEIATMRSSSVQTTTEIGTVRSLSIQTEASSYRRQQQAEISSEETDEPSTSSATTKESVKRAPSASTKHRLDLEKLAVDDNFSFSMSDMSEYESRVQALRSSLEERRRIAQKLKQEHKRRMKERLENTEKSLLNQLQAYDVYIENTEKQLKELATSQSTRPATPPKILSPRLSSDTEVPSSPGRRSTVSSPRSARLLRASSGTSQRGESISTAAVSSEVEKTAADSGSASERSESTPASVTNTPRTIASNSAPAADSNIPQPRSPEKRIEDMAASQQRHSLDADTVDEISEELDDIGENGADSAEDSMEIKASLKEEPKKPDISTPEFASDILGLPPIRFDDSTPQSIVEKEIMRQISENPSIIGTEPPDSIIGNGSDTPTRTDGGSSTVSTARRSDRTVTESETSTARASHRSEIETDVGNGSLEIAITSPTSTKTMIKEKSENATNLIINSMVYDTLDHCLSIWRNRTTNFEYYDPDAKKSEDSKSNQARKNRLVDVIVDESVSSMLDDAIRMVIFSKKRPTTLDLSNTSVDGGVVSEKQLENIRRLVSNIEEKDVDDGTVSSGTSPRSPKSPRTPPSDRYNEAFRQPSKPLESPEQMKPAALNFPDDDLASSDEQWMDDDFGLSTTESEDKSAKKSGSPRSARLDLSKFTTEIFSAVPCTRKAIDCIVDICVSTLHEQRRMGEPLNTARMPRDLYMVGKEDDDPKELELSLNRECDRAYRDFLFETCREIVDKIYNDDKNDPWILGDGTNPKWKKPPRLRFSSYAKIRPKNVADLQRIVRDVVVQNLDLDPEKYGNRNSRPRLVSRRKLDRVDEVLLTEMYEEEYDWTVYDDEELTVKFQLADGILKNALDDALDQMISNNDS